MSNKNSLRGKLNGLDFIRGYSAYEVAVINGFTGTEKEWLDTIKAESTEEAIAAANRAMQSEKNVKEAEESAKANVKAAEDEAVARLASLAEGAYDIVQTPGNSETQVMSQKAVTEYVPKVATRNLANLTFKDGRLSDSTGLFQESNGINNAAAEEYIAVIGGESYTLSWVNNDIYSLPYVYQYKEDKTYIEKSACTRTDQNSNFTLTLGNDCAYIRVCFYSPYSTQTWNKLVPDKLQIEHGTESTEYIAPLVIDNAIINLDDHPIVADVVRQSEIANVAHKQDIEDYIPKVASKKNLANLTFKDGRFSDSTGLFQVGNGINYACAEEYIAVNGGGAYTFSWVTHPIYSTGAVYQYNSNKEFLSSVSFGRIDNGNKKSTLIVGDECAYIRVRFYSFQTTQIWSDLVPDRLQIEVGEEATDYVQPLVISSEVLDQDKNASGGENSVEDVHYLGHKVNKTLGELRAVRNEVEGAVSSLLHLNDGEGVERTATIKSIGEHKKAFVRVGLHYGSRRYTAKGDELYFDGNCKKDFSDIRFYDAAGNILRAELGELVNMELAADDNIKPMLKTTSNGKLVGYDEKRGIIISEDNAVTWTEISGTHNVTTNASDVYGYTSMYPIFVDNANNIFAYAGGILYKLLASDNYATKKNVLNFSWKTSEGKTIYPDVQHHGMDVDINGNMYFGFYQDGLKYQHIDVYVSKNGGESWNLSYNKYNDTKYVHVHHIHADKYSSKVFVGIDDGGFTDFGSRIIVTDNGGATWTEITEQVDKRGKDFYPSYFGADYRLGGAEAYIMGSATVYRSVDDKHLEPVVRGVGGARSFGDFGNDDVIVCGSLLSSGVAEHHIYASYDKGKTWKSIYKKYTEPMSAAGSGYRDTHNAVQLNGDTEACVFMPHLFAGETTHHFRVYNGGDHWYREAYVEVENTTDSNITIIAKTGHTLPYPYTCLEGREHDGLVYSIPFNEGAGRYVCDSEGTMAAIKGSYKWERDEEPVRYGDYSEPTKTALVPSSGLLLDEGASINFGKIPALNFKDNFTIAFRFNTKAMFVNGNDWDKYRAHRSEVLSFGDVKLHVNGGRFGWTKGDVSNRTWATVSSFLSHSFTDGYYHLVICLENGVATAYLNGFPSSNNDDAGTFEITSNLSERNLIVGAGEKDTLGYISDIKIYNRVLSNDEVMELYRGW